MGWIGVDFDGTLVTYYGWGHPDNGAPIPSMVQRVRGWLAEGKEVRIFTARVAEHTLRDGGVEAQRDFVERWCMEHIGAKLPVTCVKGVEMIELWDDRAVSVRRNTGEPLRWERNGE